MPLAKSRTFGVRLILPQWILVPGFHIDLTADLSILDSSDDMFENVFAVWESTVDAERYPIRGDHFIGYGNVEVRTAHPPKEISDLVLADHPVGARGGEVLRYSIHSASSA
jgi:hypothetical protein